MVILQKLQFSFPTCKGSGPVLHEESNIAITNVDAAMVTGLYKIPAAFIFLTFLVLIIS